MNGYALHNDSLWADFTAENVGQYDNRPYNSVDAKYPKEITYANGKVVFDYSSSLLKPCIFMKMGRKSNVSH